MVLLSTQIIGNKQISFPYKADKPYQTLILFHAYNKYYNRLFVFSIPMIIDIGLFVENILEFQIM